MSGNWLDLSSVSNRYIQTYVKGFVDISGGNLLLRPGNNHIIVQGGDISLNGRLIIGSAVLTGDGPTVTSGNVFLGNYVTANTITPLSFIPGNIMTPATLSATAASWTNTSINWAASASSNAPGYSPYMAFTANIAGNVAVVGNVVGNGWLSATAGYNATTGLYTGTTYTTPVSTIGNVAGEWIQIQGNTATALTGFQLVATNDSTGAHNDRLPTAFTIMGTTVLNYITPWNNGAPLFINSMGLSTPNFYYSYNGITWTASPSSPFSNYGRATAYNSTMWVATGSGTNSVAYSYNGINWTAGIGFLANNDPRPLVWSGTMWVAGGNNYMAYSYNGINWTAVTQNTFSSASLPLNVIFNTTTNTWIAIGYNGSGAAIAYSYNGITWTTGPTTGIGSNGYYNTISYNGTMWVGAFSTLHYISYSYDGLTWTGLGTTIMTNYPTGIANNGTMFVATPNTGNVATLYYSYNGINWSSLNTGLTSATAMFSITYNGTLFVANANGGALIYSYNGLNWTLLTGLFGSNNPQGISSNYSGQLLNYSPILTGSFASNPYINSTTGNAAATAIYTIPTTTVTNATQGALTYSTYGNSTNTYLYYRMIVTKIAGNTYGVPTASVSGNVGGFWLPTFQNVGTLVSAVVQPYTPTTTTVSANISNNTLFFTSSTPIYSNVTTTSVAGNTLLGTSSITAANIVPNSVSALASASWVNNSISWTASASSNATNYTPNAAFPNSVAGSGWMSATTAYTNDTTGAYTGNIVTTLSTGSTVAGEWLQIQGSVAQPIVSFQLAAPNDTTNNGALPQTFTIAGVAAFNGPASAFWPSTIPPPVGTMWVAGATSNNMYYSYNGLLWTVSPTAVAGGAYDVAYSGTMWVVGTNSSPYLFYSYTGITWTGISNTPLSGLVWGIATNGSMWVSAANGTNTLVYSYNGVNWTGLGTTVITSQGFQPAYSGTMWVVGGSGTNIIAYSYNGTQWTGITGTSIFSTYGFGVATNGTTWVMVGQGTNTIAYSYNGIAWTGLGTTIFGGNGYGVATSGTMWVATGVTTNTLAYSYTGTVWTGLGSPIGTNQYGQRIAYSGSMWVTTNLNSTYTAYSYNGINWTVPATTGIPGAIQAVASNAPLYLNNVTLATPIPILSGAFTSNPFVSGNAATGTGSPTATYTIPSGNVTNATQGALTYSTYGNALNTYISYRLIVSNIAAQKFGASSATVNQRTGGFWFLGLGSSTTATLATYQTTSRSLTQANIVGYNKSQVALTLDPITPNQLDLSGGSFSIASGNAVVSSFSLGNIYTGTIIQSNIAIGNVLVGGCVMTPATLSATAASWTNTSINWTASASSNAPGYSPYMAFTANIAGNVAVVGNVVGNGWLSATAGYNATTGLYTGTTYTTPVSTIGNVAGEWIQIQGNTATALTGFQLVATNDSTGAHNDRLPTAFTIIGIQGGNTPVLSAANWGKGTAPATGTMWVSVGTTSGTSTTPICYSYNGINWTGVTGSNSFIPLPAYPAMYQGSDIAYNGTMWIFTALAANTLVYSYNGINWTGLGNPTGANNSAGYQQGPWGIATNGTMWINCNTGSYNSNYLSYSYDGFIWTGLGTTVTSAQPFSTGAYRAAYSGTMWIAAGSGTNLLAYSYSGTVWTGLTGGTTMYDIASNGTMWVAVGSGYNGIYYSYNGTSWINSSGASISTGYGVATSGTMWVALGYTTNSIAYSYDGITWTGLGTSIITTAMCSRIAYSGSMWVATSTVSPYSVYSYNGINWSATTGIGSSAYAVASNAPLMSKNLTNIPILSGSFASNPYINSITGNAAATAIYTIPTTTVTNATQGALTYSTYGNSTNTYLYYRMIVTKIAGNTYGVPTASVSGNVGGFWLPTFQNTATGYNLMNQSNYSQQTVGTQAVPNGSLVFTGSIPTYSTTVTANVYNGNTFVANTVGANNTIVSTYNINYNPTLTSTAITGYTNSSVTMSIDTVTPNQLDISGSLAVIGTPTLTTYIFGNVYTGFTNTSIAIGNVLASGCVMTPATLSATAASWSNTSINWTASASSNAPGYSPYMAFTANIAGNVAVVGNVVGNGWLSATAGYNATTGLYTGTTYTTVVSTIGNVAGEWIQIQGNTATALAGFQLVATNDSTGAHNDRLPTAFTIVGIKSDAPVLSAANWGKGTAPAIGTMWVSGGRISGTGGSSIYYSYNGINWTASPSSSLIPASAYPNQYQLFDVAYSGTMWMGYTNATHTLIYSYDGINWTGLGNPINTGQGNNGWGGGISTNGTIWIVCSAVYNSQNFISYSYDGFTWTGLGKSGPITGSSAVLGASKANYNGTLWVVCGVSNGATNLAYSYSGTVWTGIAITTNLRDVATNGTMWIAAGNQVHYSYDGITWVGLGTIIFATETLGIATSGTMWVAVGMYNNSVGYSYNGITWTGLGSSLVTVDDTTRGGRVAYSGSMWVITSLSSPYALYSYNGINWSATTGIGSSAYAVASNAPLMAKNLTNIPILTGSFASNPYINSTTGNAAATAIYTIPTTTVTNATQGALTYSTYGNSTNTYLYYRMIVTKIAGNTYGVPTASVSGNVGGFWLPTFQNTIPGIATVNQNTYTPIVVNTSASTTQGSITLSTKVPVYSASVTGNQLVSNVLTGTIYNAGNTTYNYSLTYSPLVIANSITGYTTNAVQLSMDTASTNQLNLTGNLNVTGTVYPTSMSESFTTITTSTSPLTLNFGNGATFYLTSPPSANFVCNITNVPSAIGRTYLCTLIITASATKTFCNSVQINGNTAITPYFANGIPTSITTGSFITQTIAIQRILAGDVAGSVNVLSTITPWY